MSKMRNFHDIYMLFFFAPQSPNVRDPKRQRKGERELAGNHPWMFHDFGNGIPIVDVAIEHFPDQINTIFGEWQIRDPQGVVQDFIDIVKWVLLVHHGVQKDTKGPNILFFPSVRLALKNFWRRIVCSKSDSIHAKRQWNANSPIVPTKTSNGPFLMYAALPKSISLIFPSPSRITFSSLMSRCTTRALI